MNNKKILIFGGGTVQHIASHFAVSAPAYGTTAKKLFDLCQTRFDRADVILQLTKMAASQITPGMMETNEDVAARVDKVVADTATKVVFFTCAMCDYKLDPESHGVMFGDKYSSRLETSKTKNPVFRFEPTEKIIQRIRKTRKDIFLVAFKTTCGASKQEMYEKGLALCKGSSCNLVLVNDTKTRWNMIITPEEAVYHETQDREDVLRQLVDMAYHRSHLTFTQSTVVEGYPVSWRSPRVPDSLRIVVGYCIAKNAYKPFKDATVGHFAIKLSDNEFLTSIRKSNFNNIFETGVVYVKTDGPDTVLAYGAKPSVGGQSQRTVFRDHVGFDCIVHFHCPIKPNAPDKIPVKSQRNIECGSHQCGKQTSEGLAQFGNLKAVYLENHGPNIIFNKSIDPQEVIAFIERNFDLEKKTGGYIPSNGLDD